MYTFLPTSFTPFEKGSPAGPLILRGLAIHIQQTALNSMSSSYIGRIDVQRTARNLLQLHGDSLSLERTFRPPNLLSTSPCCGYTSIHVSLSSVTSSHLPPQHSRSVIDWDVNTKKLLAIKRISACGRARRERQERCRMHHGLATFELLVREGRRGACRPTVIFQGSDEAELSSFLHLPLDSIHFIDKWAVNKTNNDRMVSHSSSEEIADLLIRPGLMKSGHHSILPLSDPESLTQIQSNDPDELDVLTREGLMRQDLTPWRRAVIHKMAKEMNGRMRGMQVHQAKDHEEEEEDEAKHKSRRPASMKLRSLTPRLIERRIK